MEYNDCVQRGLAGAHFAASSKDDFQPALIQPGDAKARMASRHSANNSRLRRSFIDGMSKVAATVSVVTSNGPAGKAGVTVSAMSSVSADSERPTLLVCVNADSASARCILENGVFCLNVLYTNQMLISRTFAGQMDERFDDRFDCAEWIDGVTGAPRLKNALAAFDCSIDATNLVGTHNVIFGAVEEVFVQNEGSALVYADRAYQAISPIT